jgi:STAS domain
MMSDPQDFNVNVLSSDGEAIVYLMGGDRPQRPRSTSGGADPGFRCLVIDLSRTTFIDSTGLKALVDVWRHRLDAGVELVLRAPRRW